ncbi:MULTISPECIES: hypothetical protein [unclassified Agarivorans]|uniref:hypothetical protein n=1 Tax=unclassified Agarivorans TaxID=2636026 RepID=UPI0026E1F1D0|nr:MULTISPECIES: hypothetical protein [unclassified Agarivorans]MDO6687359.1 hypothetical protein [Agarivorans sp. 3_MG-2023]MDO6717017.1 hypothetical protein [Agarivorans sp. 2_MG-2023]
MSQQIVLLAIKSLVDDNKQPTLALVKGRLNSRQPMPLVIEAINAYKRDPSIIEGLIPAEPAVTSTNTPSMEKRVAELESQVAFLLERVTQLEANH